MIPFNYPSLHGRKMAPKGKNVSTSAGSMAMTINVSERLVGLQTVTGIEAAHGIIIETALGAVELMVS